MRLLMTSTACERHIRADEEASRFRTERDRAQYCYHNSGQKQHKKTGAFPFLRSPHRRQRIRQLRSLGWTLERIVVGVEERRRFFTRWVGSKLTWAPSGTIPAWRRGPPGRQRVWYIRTSSRRG